MKLLLSHTKTKDELTVTYPRKQYSMQLKETSVYLYLGGKLQILQLEL